MDRAWWGVYLHDVLSEFSGNRYSTAKHHGVSRVNIKPFGNSGAGAIALASHFGARRIVLLGYDCKTGSGGERHWHEDHPKPLGNAGRIEKWPEAFNKLAEDLPRSIEILNCSRDTALNCFERCDLGLALCR